MTESATHWLGKARQLRRKINMALWLDRAAVPGVITAGVAAALVLLIRHHWPEINLYWQLAAAIIPPLVAMIVVWARVRREFIHLEEALVRLEVHHELNAALSTAYAKAGPWPQISQSNSDGLRWSIMRTSVPTCLMLALILTAWFMPVEVPAKITSITEPATWKLVENNLEKLVENQLVDKDSTEAAKRAIEELRKRPQGDWFDHSSIEAGDRILRTHQRDISDLESRMRDTARTLRQLSEARQGMTPNGPIPDGAFSDLMEDLNMGGLTPDKELLEKLQQLQGEDGNPLNQIDPRQLADLLDQLEGNAQRLQEMLEQMQGLPQPGQGEGEGEEGEGEGDGDQPMPGQGDIQRGPGEGGPLEGDPSDPQDAGQKSPLAAGDTSRSLPGDYLGEGEARHNIDPNNSPELSAGGAATQPGDGGTSVWQESLHPREQEALRRFFE